MLCSVSAMIHLVAPLTTRPLRLQDADAVCALVRRSEEHEIGEALVDLEDIVGDWQRPSLDLGRHTIGAFDGDEMVACAEVFRGRRVAADVDPAHHGRGIGTAMIGWTQQVARDYGGSLVGQSVPEDSAAARLLRTHGYAPLWQSWVLELPTGRSIPVTELNDGICIRTFEPGRDEHAAYQIVEDAFNEWPDREPSEYGDWAAGVLLRPGFEPWQLLLAVTQEGDVVGVCNVVLSGGCAFVSQLAVRRDHRNRGLARALLLEAFGAGRAHGARRAELSTDSRTGALSLYLRVGMEVTHTWVHLGKALD